MANKITENTLIFDALNINPKAGEILMNYGMHCLGCALSRGETIGQAALAHGVDVDEMIAKLNEVINK